MALLTWCSFNVCSATRSTRPYRVDAHLENEDDKGSERRAELLLMAQALARLQASPGRGIFAVAVPVALQAARDAVAGTFL